MAELVDDDTVAPVGVAGSTEYGFVDPIPAIADLAADAGVLCHVDAAWGGFYLPFTDHEWGFDHAAVDTLTIDPHKVGQAAVPAGGLIARSTDLLDELAIDTPVPRVHEPGDADGHALGRGRGQRRRRDGRPWPEGYREQYERSMTNAEWLPPTADARGHDVVGPELLLVAADLSVLMTAELRERGWRVSKTGAGRCASSACPTSPPGRCFCLFVADLDWY